jgi:hypothetical protein
MNLDINREWLEKATKEDEGIVSVGGWLQPLCHGCGRPFLAIEPDPAAHCDDCFICDSCRKRIAFRIEDPPPLNMCSDCLKIEEERLCEEVDE